jgi:iron complex outermembrane recepter protein
MQKIFLFLTLIFVKPAFGQKVNEDVARFSIRVVNEKQQPLEGVTIELFTKDSVLVKAAITSAQGSAVFEHIVPGAHFFKVSHSGYVEQVTDQYLFPLESAQGTSSTIVLSPAVSTMQGVTVAGTRPFVQHVQGKVLINVDAAISNTGTTVLEVLEKSPGVMVDKNGTISLQAKTGVQVMIDGKPTYLSGTDLTNLLSSMSSSQVDQIELMVNPPARYDASGNAGIINIKTKKNKQKGFNGSFSTAYGQGRYPKNNSSLVMNYRNGKFNTFLTYGMNSTKYFSNLYAFRRYFDPAGSLIAALDQPTVFSGKFVNNTLKTGMDYYISDKTTVGVAFTGMLVSRNSKSDATATWKNAGGSIDSAVATNSNSKNSFKNGSINLNLKHTINKQQDLALDIDWLNYDLRSEQFFNSNLLVAGGYNEASRGDIPSAIQIFSARADHTVQIGAVTKLESGWKSSHISTDNLAAYQSFSGTVWSPDYGKSNHFLYSENIHALYSSVESKYKRISMQAGLRYEYTSYEADQLGNVVRKDSAFSRNYKALFPSGYISYQVDSSNSFTVTAGRRIDRPAFQKLNPFVFIINKYTYQSGNPFFLPQYSWNLELSHQYKELLTTAVSYSFIKNYFSQLFLTDTTGILIYSEGNVGRVHNVGLSVTLQASPVRWWSFTAQGIFNHKALIGYADKKFSTSVNQVNVNLNNQFKIGKTYTAELSGFYTTRARNDLQELLYPTGQLSVGIARPILKKKATLKLAFRDLLYTQRMEGLTQFQSADEYFIERRDSRVLNISFTWRFGKPLKTTRRSGGGAGDEMERVGNG